MSDPTRDLILVLADSKRLLGMRYAEWILGAPALEAGIACASMAQDEWGHGRLLYALLRDFGDDVERLEHGREPGEYRNIELLDSSPESWPELVIVNALVDTALSVQLDALRNAEHAPLRQRVLARFAMNVPEVASRHGGDVVAKTAAELAAGQTEKR